LLKYIGWLELRYGDSSKPEIISMLQSLPPEQLQKKYWFQNFGGYLTWFVEEERQAHSNVNFFIILFLNSFEKKKIKKFFDSKIN